MEFSLIIEQIADALKVPLRDLAIALGEREDRFYKIKAAGARPNHAFLQKLVLTFPQVNAEFLLTGLGEPLKKEPAEAVSADPHKDTIILSLTETIQQLRKRLEELESELAP